jgi:hypothetical protein
MQRAQLAYSCLIPSANRLIFMNIAPPGTIGSIGLFFPRQRRGHVTDTTFSAHKREGYTA